MLPYLVPKQKSLRSQHRPPMSRTEDSLHHMTMMAFASLKHKQLACKCAGKDTFCPQLPRKSKQNHDQGAEEMGHPKTRPAARLRL